MAQEARPGSDGRDPPTDWSQTERRTAAIVGRAAELERLDAALRRTREGHSTAVIVGGEAGVGKTRLVEALADRARSEGCLVLTGGCLDLGERGIPYAPFVEAFRTLVRTTDAATLPSLLGPGRAVLGRLIPELDAHEEPSGPEPPGARGGQTRLFELIQGLLERLARGHPVVLVIEDLQWADQSTRDLLSFLVHVVRRTAVLFVVTARSEELRVGHPVLPYMAELERLASVDRIEVLPLGRGEVAQQVTAILGRRPSDEQVDAIVERTNGNPFFVEQILASRPETPGPEVPPRLRDVLLGRLAQLSPGAQEVLRAASAAGARIDDDMLAEVSDLPSRELRDHLREVIEHGILVAVGGQHQRQRYAFRHDLLREVVYQRLFPGERRRLHAAYASALTARLAEPGGTLSAPASPGELAYHWDASGEYQRALPATIEAGDAAMRVYAHADAARSYERALALWELASDPASLVGVDRAAVLERAAEAAVTSGAHARAVELGEAAIAALPDDADLARRAWLHERLRWYLFTNGDRERAEVELRLAERLVPREPPSGARCVIVAHQAGIEMFAGHYLRSRALAEEAIAIADACDVPAQRAISMGILGWSLAMLGDAGTGLDLFRGGLAAAEEDASAEGVALGYSSLAQLLDLIGRHEEAVEVARRGLEHAHRMGFVRTYGGSLLAAEAGAAITLGRWDEAAQAIAEGLQRQPVGRQAVGLLTQRARLAIGRGGFDQAALDIEQARAADERLGGTGYRLTILAAEAELACWQARVAACRRATELAYADVPDGPPEPALCWLATVAVRAEADAAERSRARHDVSGVTEAVERAQEVAGRLADLAARPLIGGSSDTGHVTHVSAHQALIAAEVTRALGTPDPAAWAEAATKSEGLGRPYLAAHARYQEAVAIMATQRDRTTAEEALRAAHRVATHLGAGPLTREIEVFARQARLALDESAPTAPGAPDSQVSDHPEAPGAALDGLGLTTREVEVLRLVAGGWTNQQIADALFITRKTASVHVSNILGKLGVDRRIEAAAIAHRLGADVPDPPDAR